MKTVIKLIIFALLFMVCASSSAYCQNLKAERVAPVKAQAEALNFDCYYGFYQCQVLALVQPYYCSLASQRVERCDLDSADSCRLPRIEKAASAQLIPCHHGGDNIDVEDCMLQLLQCVAG